MIRRVPRAIATSRVLLLLATPAVVFSAANQAMEALPQMTLEEILNVKLTVATRTETTLLEAPSIVSVITSEDIRRMGARNLQDVLRTVPGFELGVWGQLGYPEFGLRGVSTNTTEKIRILLDGVAVNENLEGSGTIVFGDFTLENVERIEIIRGPGSAMYGTNAFLGVISIITKEPPPSGRATTLTATRGSFNTSEGSVSTGWSGSKFRISSFIHYLDTDGPRSHIEKDAMPDATGSNLGVSLAGTPDGHTDQSERKVTAQLKMAYDNIYFNAVLVDIHRGPYIGPQWTINKNSDAHPYQIQGALGATFRPAENWIIEPRVYALHYKCDNLWNLYPNGTQLGAADYTQGLYIRNGGTQDTFGGELKTTWNAPRNHKAVMGVSIEEQKLYHIVNLINLPGTGSGQLVDAGDIMKKNPNRVLSSVYIQDQWNPVMSLGVTAGVRMDHYNDAGTALSPRVAFVWQVNPKLNLKLLYGEAFRAPTFAESYLSSTGGNLYGRENNKPETIRTSEMEASYRFGERVLWRMDFFHNRISDLIQRTLQPNGTYEYQNTPDVTVIKGIETELRLAVNETISGYVNYSCQSGRNQATNEALVGMANWRANAGVNVTPSDRLNLNASLNMVGKRQRSSSDLRPELAGYHVVNMAAIFTPVPSLDVSLTAHNVFNQDQRFPDVDHQVVNDFPWEGRDLRLGVRWHF